MKTTVEIPDALLAEARRLALREGTTIRELVEEGLRHVLRKRGQRSGFQLRNAAFRGEGLHPDSAGASWDEVRRQIYEGRGG